MPKERVRNTEQAPQFRLQRVTTTTTIEFVGTISNPICVADLVKLCTTIMERVPPDAEVVSIDITPPSGELQGVQAAIHVNVRSQR